MSIKNQISFHIYTDIYHVHWKVQNNAKWQKENMKKKKEICVQRSNSLSSAIYVAESVLKKKNTKKKLKQLSPIFYVFLQSNFLTIRFLDEVSPGTPLSYGVFLYFAWQQCQLMNEYGLDNATYHTFFRP